uniref:Ig-like domain-containing protein n=1 Tax=Heterorhabditis bacteriophora TaxID=37862 RepID=A0A1I7XDQ9_HETBA
MPRNPSYVNVNSLTTQVPVTPLLDYVNSSGQWCAQVSLSRLRAAKLHISVVFDKRCNFSFVKSICLSLLQTAFLLSAWNLVISPHGERLQNRRTGDNFLVVCKVKDYDGAASDTKVEWYRNGNLLSRLGNIMTIYKTYSNQLMINRPTISDGGEYICKADVNGEKQEAKADISFTARPVITVFDIPANNRGNEGQSSQLKCGAVGKPKPDYKWLNSVWGRTTDFSKIRLLLGKDVLTKVMNYPSFCVCPRSILLSTPLTTTV